MGHEGIFRNTFIVDFGGGGCHIDTGRLGFLVENAEIIQPVLAEIGAS